MLVVLVIIYATWVPKPMPYEDLPKIQHIDKLIHAVMFGGLTGALLFDYHRNDPRRHQLTWRIIVAVACCVAAFGIVDEMVQGLLNIGRPSDPWDILANCGGILIAVFTAPPLITAIFRKN